MYRCDTLLSKYLFPVVLISFLFCAGVFTLILWRNAHPSKLARFQSLSQKFPPGSIQGRRLRAVAGALENGKTTYSYSSPALPFGGKPGDPKPK